MTERSHLRALVLFGVLVAAAPLAGCIVPIVAGTAVGGYTLATEQRSPEQLARDAAIGAAAHKYWSDVSSDLARDLDATVYDGNLLITGIVPNQAMKDKGEELARHVDGIKKIYDNVEVGQPTNLAQDARDNYASNALRTQLLGNSQVRSSNFTVHTLNGVVYIMGYARNAPERDLVLSYARNLPNVQRVVPYIEVGNESPPAAPASAPSGAPPPPPPPPPAAAQPAPGPPRSIIEVQPLQ